MSGDVDRLLAALETEAARLETLSAATVEGINRGLYPGAAQEISMIQIMLANTLRRIASNATDRGDRA